MPLAYGLIASSNHPSATRQRIRACGCGFRSNISASSTVATKSSNDAGSGEFFSRPVANSVSLLSLGLPDAGHTNNARAASEISRQIASRKLRASGSAEASITRTPPDRRNCFRRPANQKTHAVAGRALTCRFLADRPSLAATRVPPSALLGANARLNPSFADSFKRTFVEKRRNARLCGDGYRN